ncbi:MAG: 16S rRNA (cytidine(1402)-2'-O)-methyltransferase [Thermodesulfobacteria bacterium]|nr:16S rRNA (cytidine(1402)-2'-O)-methyltransferase [Thermodesulfobacteriota bacterium]
MSENKQRAEAGVLYVVATPIGNLRDITLRALDILESADILACEDTRTALKLLNRFGIRGPKLVAYHEHNENERAPQLIAALKQGQSVALISEAGTPGISDPGARLVALAHEEGVPVRPVPGPSALAAALSVSGFDLRRGFLYLGFPPAKRGERRKYLSEVAHERRPLVLFESPHRLAETLEDLYEILGERRVFLAREMTKRHEEYTLSELSALKERFAGEEARGEVTLVIEGAAKSREEPEGVEVEEELSRLLDEGVPLKEASRLLAQRTGLSAKEIYRLGLKLKKS